MARSDLLVNLVKSSASGDKQAFQKTVEPAAVSNLACRPSRKTAPGSRLCLWLKK
jgi:hypothetical protein